MTMITSPSKLLIPFSAVTVVLLLGIQLATAQEKDCFDQRSEKCIDEYVTRITNTQHHDRDFCNIIRQYIDCLGEAYKCEEESAENWRLVRYLYFVIFNGTCDWGDMLDEFPPEFASGIAFGDPHYVMNGKSGVHKVVTCNKPGRILLARGRRWSVHVNHKVVGSSEGAVVDEVIVRVFNDVKGFVLEPVGAPLREVKYTLSSLPKAETADGISIRPDGLTTEWGLEVSAKRRDGSYFEVGVSGPDMNNGILVNGDCASRGDKTPTIPSKRRFSAMDLVSLARHRSHYAQAATRSVPEKCKSVDKAFQQACAYDAEQMNETWAAESTSSAVSLAAEMKEKEKKSQQEANKKRNGVAATMIQGSVILVAIMIIINLF